MLAVVNTTLAPHLRGWGSFWQSRAYGLADRRLAHAMDGLAFSGPKQRGLHIYQPCRGSIIGAIAGVLVTYVVEWLEFD